MASGGGPRPPRSAAAIESDLADLDVAAAEARAYMARIDGTVYRDGQCILRSLRTPAMPALAFEGDSALLYGAARCSTVLGPNRATCDGVRAGTQLGAEQAFTGAACERRLTAMHDLIGRASRLDPDAAAAGLALADQARRTVARGADRREAASRCIVEVSALAADAHQRWREESDKLLAGPETERRRCQASLALLIDESARREALQAELAESQNAATRRASPPTNDLSCAMEVMPNL